MTLEERVAKIPGDDGWWKEGPEEDFYHLAKLLVHKGFMEIDAIEVLKTAYWAASAEFGN